MKIRQHLTRWQTRVQMFRWGRQNKQLLPGTLPDANGDGNNASVNDDKPSLTKPCNSTTSSGVQKATGLSHVKSPISWILRSPRAERLIESEDRLSSSVTENSLNVPFPSNLTNGGIKSSRYARLTNQSMVSEHNPSNRTAKTNSNKNRKGKFVTPKWSELTDALRYPKRLKSSNDGRLKSHGGGMVLQEESKRDDFHTYAFDNAGLDLYSQSSDKSKTIYNGRAS